MEIVFQEGDNFLLLKRPCWYRNEIDRSIPNVLQYPNEVVWI